MLSLFEQIVVIAQRDPLLAVTITVSIGYFYTEARKP